MNKMAKETKDAVPEKLFSIEELKASNQTADPIFEGTKVMKRWKSGKEVTAVEYERAVKDFLAAPAGRSK